MQRVIEQTVRSSYRQVVSSKNYSKAKMHDISKQNKNKSMIRKLRCDTAQDAVASQPEYCIA